MLLCNHWNTGANTAQLSGQEAAVPTTVSGPDAPTALAARVSASAGLRYCRRPPLRCCDAQIRAPQAFRPQFFSRHAVLAADFFERVGLRVELQCGSETVPVNVQGALASR